MDDCLVVGAGVIGLSLAYELARAGLRVRVVDSGPPGKEASWAGAGILPPASFQATHPLEKLRAQSNQLHAEWAETLRSETGIDTGYRRSGVVRDGPANGQIFRNPRRARPQHLRRSANERKACSNSAKTESGRCPALSCAFARRSHTIPV